MIAISEAAHRLALTPRALRYREALGLLPVRHGSGRHRRFTENDIATVQLVLAIEKEHHVGPSEVAFALRALRDPALAARLRALGDIPSRVLEFEQEKAERLLAGTR
jgi:MerR family transcriptional regulator, copper efflux regulator